MALYYSLSFKFRIFKVLTSSLHLLTLSGLKTVVIGLEMEAQIILRKSCYVTKYTLGLPPNQLDGLDKLEGLLNRVLNPLE